MPLDCVNGPVAQLHVDDAGAGGLPVVFIHSFAGNTSHWAAQLAHLRKNRRAVAFDLRAHGESAAPANGDFAIESLAGDVSAVADGLGLKRFVLVGHSIGGAVAIAYADANPDRVAGLVLAGTPGKVPDEQAQQILAAMEKEYDNVMRQYWQKLLTGARRDVRTRIESEMASLSKDVSMRIIRSTFEFDPRPALARYHGPTLVLFTSSGDTPGDLQNLMPEVPHQKIEGTSHWMQMDDPDEFNQVLDAFLAHLGPSRA